VTVYEKGAWVFHMLRAMMLDLRTQSEDRFTDMMRDYYTSYLGASATTEDFQRVVERNIGMDMTWFFDQWVKGTDIPTYRVAWRSEPAGEGRFRVRLRVSQENVPADFRMPVLVAADLGQNRLAHFRIDIHGPQAEYTSPIIPGEPRNVIFNEHHSVLADVRTERW
jgi:aminopeptidase N